MADESRYSSFKNFWPYYLSEHDNPQTRTAHAWGTAIGAVATIAASVTVASWLLPIGIIGIYSFLTASHVMYQGNIPATFQEKSPKKILKNVLWAAAGDMRMVGMWFRSQFGKDYLREEYKRLGLNPEGKKRPKAAKKAPEVKAPEAAATLPAAEPQKDFNKATEAAPKNEAPAATPPTATPPTPPAI